MKTSTYKHRFGSSRRRRLRIETLEDRRVLAALVGVDFDLFGPTPTNWNQSNNVPTFETDLNDELGLATRSDIGVNFFGSGAATVTNTFLDFGNVPNHDPFLDPLDGALIVSNANPGDVVLIDVFELRPDTDYEVFVFGHHGQFGQTVNQQVTVYDGFGSQDFTQTIQNEELWVNGSVGFGAPLEFFSVLANSGFGGQLSIEVTPLDASGMVGIAGVALREFNSPPRVVSSSLQSGDSVAAGEPLLYTVTFDDPLIDVFFDSSDVQLFGSTFGPQTPTVVFYDPNFRELTVQYDTLPADVYTLTLFGSEFISADSFQPLDGENFGFVSELDRSGDGFPGGDFELQFTAFDFEPPMFTFVPPDMFVQSPEGLPIVVDYPVPTAIDNADPNPLVACSPESGSAFPIGQTLVECTATDLSGNTITTTFTINVSQANDAFRDRVDLGSVAFANDTGSNVGFTGEAGETIPNSNWNPIQSAWWSWTAPANGTVTIDTAGSNFDTTLTVSTGTAINSLSTVDSNDDAIGLQSRVNFAVVAGVEYQIAVDGFSAATGEIVLNLQLADFATEAAGGNQSHNEVQPSLTLNYIIAVQGIFPSQSIAANAAGETSGALLATNDPFLGEVSLFAGNFAPQGWAFAQGQLLPINQYQSLYSLLGTTYGGDGETTFALPDLRGRVPIGFGQGAGLPNYPLGSRSGSEHVTLSPNQIPSHTHDLPNPAGDTLAAGGTQSHDNMQPYLAMNYLISVQGTYPSPSLAEDEPSFGGTEPFLGEVILFAGNFAPQGWAMAQGQLLPISSNTALYSILGTTYGGDGETTFALPDLRGRAAIGTGTGPGLSTRLLGQKAGIASVTLGLNQLPNHDHDISAAWGTTGLQGGSQNHNNMQPYLALNYIVPLFGIYPSSNLQSGDVASAAGNEFLGGLGLFAGTFSPSGFVLAQGQLLSIPSNDALFSLVGTIYGGDGQSTFALPDLRGRVAVGQGTGSGLTTRSLGARFGTETESLSEAQLPTHRHDLQLVEDYGDAPDPTYPTLAASGGAHHLLVPDGPYLGTGVDGETNGQPTAAADGDGLSDDDGVQFGTIRIGATVAGININLQGATSARVDAWLDVAGDGVWDPTDQILTNVPVAGGMQTLNFNIPTGAVEGQTIARIRVSTAGGLDVGGPAADGEVEDHLVTIVAPPSVETVEVNGGDATRSAVTSITVVFDTEVDHTALDSAFMITNITSATAVGLINVSATDSGGKTTAVLTFDGASTIMPLDEQLSNTLDDGNYRLDILSSQVRTVSGGTEMLADYVFGGQLRAAPNNDNFFRHYGDDNGDGFTDFTDFANGFLPAFGSQLGVGMNYNEGLDGNRDGFVDFTDFTNEFLPHFGTQRP